MNQRRVKLDIRTNSLVMSLTPEGREHVRERLEDFAAEIEREKTEQDPWDRAAYQDQLLYDLLQYHTCNGWSWIRPEEIGALTAAPIISDEVVTDYHGPSHGGRVFAYMDYQVLDPVREMYEHGEATWVRDEVTFKEETAS